MIGLINAIDNFDPAQNTKLRTYAEFRIRGAILDSLRDTDWAPRMKRKLARELAAGLSRAEQKLRRSPEEAEIASRTAIFPSTNTAKSSTKSPLSTSARSSLSAMSARCRSAPRTWRRPMKNRPLCRLERAELERLIASAIDGIPKVEKTVLSLYFYEELTLREIGEIMGLHFSRVSQIKSQAILRLRIAIGRRWPGVRS